MAIMTPRVSAALLDGLPHVDEHAMTIEAGVDAVWAALLETVDTEFSAPAAVYARVIGVASTRQVVRDHSSRARRFPGFGSPPRSPGPSSSWRAVTGSRRTR